MPVANAFGCTFYLAPAYSMRIPREDALLLTEFARLPGLAMIIRSEVQPTSHLVELVKAASTGVDVARMLLGAEALLGPDANRILKVPNAGGASIVSEAMSCEILSRAFGMRLKQTEMEINYWPSNSSITDFSLDCEGTTLGCSVTRAMAAPHGSFGVAEARHLLHKKLSGVLRSTANACGAWEKQILHVWAQSHEAADALETAYAQLEPALTADTVVLISVCEGLRVLFEEKAAKVGSPGATARVARALKGLKDEKHLRVLAESDPLQQNARVEPGVCLLQK